MPYNMGLLGYIFQWLFFMFLLFPTSINSARLRKTPRLQALGLKFLRDPSKTISSSSSDTLKDIEIKYYEQTLDHFNYKPQSYATFNQKYMINSKYWGGANSSSPIFAYFGAEEPLDVADFAYIGTLAENAPRFKALQVYIEHRFYGDSIPFGLTEEAMLKNESIRGYFSSVQALADFAEILLHVKQMLSAPNSPIIVFGGSYGGMLAAWFRLKYPHVAMGAVAVSAPILYFPDVVPQDAYFSVVQKDFKERSESCFETIQKSWDIIYKIASEPNGLSILSRKFKTCSQLSTVDDLSEFLVNRYRAAAQYDAPPQYLVKVLCNGIDEASKNATDVLDQFSAGIHKYASFGFKKSCFDLRGYSSYKTYSWDWQTCSNMVMPIGGNSNITIVREKPFNLEQRTKECKKYYGVSPRPHWATTYYGGQDIKLVLSKFGSNIIFSNGLRDPWSSGGVLESLSDSLVAIYTLKGSHCLDMYPATKTDPEWLVEQRKKEVQIMEKWITSYYVDLSATKINNAKQKLLDFGTPS